MKYSKGLIILSILIIGLLFITADSYAEDKLPGYVKSEGSSSSLSIPDGVVKDAMKERFGRYLELQNEADPNNDIAESPNQMSWPQASEPAVSMGAFSESAENTENNENTVIGGHRIITDNTGSDADTGTVHGAPIEDDAGYRKAVPPEGSGGVSRGN